MGVAREIAQYFFGPSERAFAVDDPFLLAQRRQIGREGFCIRERSVLAEELQLPGLVRSGELLQDQPAEQAREHAHAEKEIGAALDPARPVERDAAARHDHVNMWMMGERRAP